MSSLQVCSAAFLAVLHGCWLPACCQVLRLLIRLYEECPQPDCVVICQCLMFLDDAAEVAKILNRLLNGSEVSADLDAACAASGTVLDGLSRNCCTRKPL
jgi:hypothetical protein